MALRNSEKLKMPMDATTYMKHVLAYKKSLACPICQVTVRVPVQSPCGHVFCGGCYYSVSNVSATDANGVPCPKCGEHWNHQAPRTSPLLQIALDTYLDVIKLHNQLAKLNGKKEEFVPESRVGDFEFPAQLTVVTQPPRPKYYELRTPRRPVLEPNDTPPRAAGGADGNTDREPPPMDEGAGTADDGDTQRETRVQQETETETTVVTNVQPELEAPSGRKRKAAELDVTFSDEDTSGDDLINCQNVSANILVDDGLVAAERLIEEELELMVRNGVIPLDAAKRARLTFPVPSQTRASDSFESMSDHELAEAQRMIENELQTMVRTGIISQDAAKRAGIDFPGASSG